MGKKLNGVTLAGLFVAAGAVGIAHAQEGQQQEPMPEQRSGQMQGQQPAAEVGQMTTETATIEMVDRRDRRVTLRMSDGRSRTVTVPKDVAAFDRLKPGDQVDIGFYEGVAVSMGEPGQTRPGMRETTTTRRMGDTRTTVTETTATVKIVGVDPSSNEVTFTGPSGATRTITVKNPEMQRRVRELEAGDTVQLTFTEATAVHLRPAKGQQQKSPPPER